MLNEKGCKTTFKDSFLPSTSLNYGLERSSINYRKETYFHMNSNTQLNQQTNGCVATNFCASIMKALGQLIFSQKFVPLFNLCHLNIGMCLYYGKVLGQITFSQESCTLVEIVTSEFRDVYLYTCSYYLCAHELLPIPSVCILPK